MVRILKRAPLLVCTTGDASVLCHVLGFLGSKFLRSIISSPLCTASMNYGNRIWRSNGQNANHNQTSRNAMNQEWNLTYLPNTPTANSSVAINVQITNVTQDGGVLWTVQSESIAYNGTTLQVTNGNGGIGKLNRAIMIGNATNSNGSTLRWSLEGLATLYSGTMIISLTGSVAPLNNTTAASTQPYQSSTIPRVVVLTYIATIS